MQQLTAVYGRSGGHAQDLLLIEQLDWMPYVGGLTTFAMVSYLAGLIYDDEKYKPYYDCGIRDGKYVTALYVYPLVPGLQYHLEVTHGKLGKRREMLALMQETVQVKLSREIGIKYPVAEIVSARWQGDCHDRRLNVVPPPALHIAADRKSLRTEREVYGTVAIKYRSERHVYSLTVPKRQDALENHYSSVALGIFDGGPPAVLVISPPPSAEELDGECAQGGGDTGVEPPEDEPPDWPDPHADRTTVYNWCDPHELISDDVVGV